MKEITTAKDLGISIFVIIDQDRYNPRSIIDQHISRGMGHLFRYFPLRAEVNLGHLILPLSCSEQVIGFTSEHRRTSWEKLKKAITRVVTKLSSQAPTPPIHGAARIEDKSTKKKESNGEIFQRLVLAQHDSAENCFIKFSKDGDLSRKGTATASCHCCFPSFCFPLIFVSVFLYFPVSVSSIQEAYQHLADCAGRRTAQVIAKKDGWWQQNY